LSELEDLGRNLVYNYVNLFNGRFVSHLIGALGSLLVIRILQPEAYGDLSIAMSLPFVVGAFGSLGVNTAIVRFTSKAKIDNPEYAKSVIVTGVIFDLLYGLVLSVLAYFLSPFIFNVIYDKPELTDYGRFSSLYLLAYWGFNSIFSAFLGLEMTKRNSALWILHYSLQTLFTVTLALAWSKVYGVILGYTLSYAAVVAYGLVLMWRDHILQGARPSMRTVGQILSFSVPLSASSSVGNAVGVYTNSLAIRVLSVLDISNINASSRISFFFDTIFNPLSYAIQPLMSKLNGRDRNSLISAVNEIMKLNLIVQLPMIITVTALASPIIDVIAGAQYSSGPFYLRLSMIGYILGSVTEGSVINSLITFQGYTKFTMRNGLLNTALYGVLFTVMVLKFGPLGYFASGWIAGFPSYFLALRFVRSKFDFRFPLKMVAKVTLISFAVLSPLFPLSFTVYSLAAALPLLLLLLKVYVKAGVLQTREVEVFVKGLESTNMRFLSKLALKVLS